MTDPNPLSKGRGCFSTRHHQKKSMTSLKPTLSISMLLLIGSAMTGCSTMVTTDTKDTPPASASFRYNFKIPTDAKMYRLRDPFVEAGVTALGQGNYQRASDAFNHALKLDPENSYIHFLNALSYHLMAAQGDSSKLSLARIGYQTAEQYDNTAWWNKYFLGLLEFDQGNYQLAQNYFAQALLVDENNPEILKGLVAATYYSGDIRLSSWLLDIALQKHQADAELLRSAAIIYAAAANQEKANAYFDEYRRLKLPPYRTINLQSRIKDWTRFNANDEAHLAAAKVQAPNVDQSDKKNPNDVSTRSEAENNQVVVDVVIIQSTERVVDHQGLNLLNGLSIAFGATDTKTKTSVDVGTAQSLSSASQSYAYPRVITRTIAIPSLTYSLNILNTIGDKEEVTAKPTLIALNGKQSKFFSGGELTIGFPSTLGGGSLQTKQVGVTLSVTPTFLSDDQIKLSVSATRDAFEDIAPINSFEQSVYTSKNSVTASVVMGFNQTLVLSGLTERGTQTIENKVPWLGDIPLVKLLFNDKKKALVEKSMVFMLTPRRPQVVGVPNNSNVEKPGNSERIRKILSEWRSVAYTSGVS
ncbi:MAG: hypothetical protein AB1832_15620 [Pseudomonadota bacterium]